MKTYINADMQIVRVNSNDIIATSAQIGVGSSVSNGTAQTPGRRSIWD